MILIRCEADECENNEDGYCSLGRIHIVTTFHADVPAACDDYKEWDERQENRK